MVQCDDRPSVVSPSQRIPSLEFQLDRLCSVVRRTKHTALETKRINPTWNLLPCISPSFSKFREISSGAFPRQLLQTLLNHVGSSFPSIHHVMGGMPSFSSCKTFLLRTYSIRLYSIACRHYRVEINHAVFLN